MKNVNYTEEQVRELVAAYVAAEDDASRLAVVIDYAELYGKTVASIRAKLVREGVYVAKEYKTKKGGKPQSKEDMVTLIAAAMNVASDRLVGLEKANKNTLSLILDALTPASKEVSE